MRLIAVPYALFAWILVVAYQVYMPAALQTVTQQFSVTLTQDTLNVLVWANTFIAVWLLTSAIPSLLTKTILAQLVMVFAISAASIYTQTQISWPLLDLFTRAEMCLVYLVAPYVVLIAADHYQRARLQQKTGYTPEYVHRETAKTRFKKSVAYRVSATLFAQAVTYAAFRRLDFNMFVLFIDAVQFLFHYVFETVWSRL